MLVKWHIARYLGLGLALRVVGWHRRTKDSGTPWARNLMTVNLEEQQDPNSELPPFLDSGGLRIVVAHQYNTELGG